MALGQVRFRLPLGVQVGMVAALFVAALIALWTTGVQVVARERRRAEAKGWLNEAGDLLAARGSEIIGRAGGFPLYPDDRLQSELDRELSSRAAAALAGFEGVKGGYFVLAFKSFFGTTPARGSTSDVATTNRDDGSATRGRGESSLPPAEADLIDIQVDAAIRKKQVLFSIEELEGRTPVTVAIRTAPVTINDRLSGATWVMTRLVDPPFVDRSLQGYRLAAGLALGGIALAFGLTTGLARTVRRQTVERARLQTDLRRSERLAALGKLLAGVAHEVRNPLAGIRSTVQLWQRGIGPDAESFVNLHDEVDRLEQIVARLLHFSRADAQDHVPGDLNAVVAEAARLAAGPAEAQGVHVKVELDPAILSVEMAPPALLQVFRNLTTNALHAMPDGGQLRLATSFDPKGRLALVTVADTGPGLSSDTVSHLFEPFYTTKAGGTGLGLAIAREIALAHRGDLHAANRTAGPGAVFTLTLPAALTRSNGESR
jgi:two-component system, NtrC family, sensor histidine kinase HydH